MLTGGTTYTLTVNHPHLASGVYLLKLDSPEGTIDYWYHPVTGRKIQTEAHSEMEKVQREYFLREQLKAIQKELGERDEQQNEVEELRKKIAEVGAPGDRTPAQDASRVSGPAAPHDTGAIATMPRQP